MNAKLTKCKNFKKGCFKLMRKAAFGKTMENIRKHRDIKLVTIEARRNYFVSEPKYYKTNYFSEYLIVLMLMNKPLFRSINISNQ